MTGKTPWWIGATWQDRDCSKPRTIRVDLQKDWSQEREAAQERMRGLKFIRI